MLLFWRTLATVFVAEMGDKTQLMMIAMTSRYKLRDILLGAGAAILVLNAIAVGFGALVSSLIPEYLIKLAAALAFFYFAWSSLREEEEEAVHGQGKGEKFPAFGVFCTFFLAELGDKTQLTAIAFGASAGARHALLIWAACSVGLFAADVLGMLIGYLLKSKVPERFFQLLAFVIFAAFGVSTMLEGGTLLFGPGKKALALAGGAALIFLLSCVCLPRGGEKK